MYVVTAKAVGAGDVEEDGGLDDAVGDAGESRISTTLPLSMTAGMQAIEHEVERFTLEKGLDATTTTTTTRAPGRTT